MASKRKVTANLPAAQETPLETYGYPGDPMAIRMKLGRKAQSFFDMYAFGNRTPIDMGAPPRHVLYKRVAEALCPKFHEYHTWTDRVINALCYHKWIAVAGCAGCVRGDTGILNPLTGEEPTIQYLCENGIAPTIMTLSGPAQADVPFVKGVQELLEVRLSDGSVFYSTGEHRVLSPLGFVEVSSLYPGQTLFSYAPIRQASNSEPGLLIHERDARDFLKKEQDCQGHCFRDLRLSGEQLQLAIKASQSSSPSHICAPKHTRACQHSDDPASTRAHIHGCEFFHLSTTGFDYHHNFSCTLSPLPLGPEMPAHAWSSFLSTSQFHLENNPQRPCLEQFACSLHRRRDFYVGHLKGDSEFGLRVSQSYITSIRTTGKHLFYDISVPGVEHYFAEGCIHHNSAKTRNVLGVACNWWMCNPSESNVILCSTTSKALRKRGWAEVQNYYSSMPIEAAGPNRFGNFVDSRMLWQVKKGDDKHAIVGIAVEEGETNKVADNIKGIHTKRQMVIIDEATAVPEAIFEACTNLHGYPEEFILIMIGNPRSWLDQFGKFMEPKDGISSISVDSEEWETTVKIDGKPGICIRFDIEKTPNLEYPEDKPISRHIPTIQRLRQAQNSQQKDSPSYWSNERGFPPPENLGKHLFSEPMLESSRAYDLHRFTGENFQIIGSLDTARTGDKPTLRFAALGEIETGEMGIEVMPPIVVPVNVVSKNPIAFQIVEYVIRACQHVRYRGTETSCPAKNLGIDSTGGGADQCDIFNRLWSYEIIRVGFGESASEDACSHEDMRPANEVHRNKRSEMYHRTRSAVLTGQLKGLDKETAKQACTIEFDDSKSLITITDKDDYKKKYGKSPDEMDSLVILLEVARKRGFRLAVTGQTKKRYAETDKQVEKINAVYDTGMTFSQANEESPLELVEQTESPLWGTSKSIYDD